MASRRTWKDAVEEGLIVAGILDHTHSDPDKAVKDLLNWSEAVVLDPAVSARAQKLVEQGEAKQRPYIAALEALHEAVRGYFREEANPERQASRIAAMRHAMHTVTDMQQTGEDDG